MTLFTTTSARAVLVLLSASVALATTQLPASAASDLPAPEQTTIDQALREMGADEAVPSDLVLEPLTGDEDVRIAASVERFGFGLPATGGGSTLDDGVTTLYDGASDGTSVAVQPVATGARALVLIQDESATTTFDFPVTGDTDRLQLSPTGSVTALDSEGTPLATAAPAWAVDAEGTPVPTHFEVDGTTLRQVVDHDAADDVAYPVTADPVWAVVIAAAARQCAAGALSGIASTALIDIYKGRASSKRDYVLNAIASCLVGPVGYWAWKVLLGATKRWLVRQVLYFVIYVIRRVR
ncbi:hypothetical protein [Marmoricola sp. Leaf446]|uniref:hypothetical protein n=1 Tax=Marmoricola sp. Leaf446 TaxID=1736379 RepID=UPI0012E3E777|nr:hypothetical protein [Marmoricola sp. Leaf446]